MGTNFKEKLKTVVDNTQFSSVIIILTVIHQRVFKLRTRKANAAEIVKKVSCGTSINHVA